MLSRLVCSLGALTIFQLFELASVLSCLLIALCTKDIQERGVVLS